MIDVASRAYDDRFHLDVLGYQLSAISSQLLALSFVTRLSRVVDRQKWWIDLSPSFSTCFSKILIFNDL
jgi:hypothetical protein